MENISYVVGFATGFIIVLVIALIIRKTAKKKGWSDDFDERQQIARGKAYKSGLFTTLIATSIFAVLYAAFEGKLPVEISFVTVLFTILILGVLVFAIQSIWTDSYVSFRNKPTSNLVLFIILSVLQIGMYFLKTKDGEMGTSCLIVGIALGIIAINMVIKMIYDKQHKEDDNDSTAENEE